MFATICFRFYATNSQFLSHGWLALSLLLSVWISVGCVHISMCNEMRIILLVFVRFAIAMILWKRHDFPSFCLCARCRESCSVAHALHWSLLHVVNKHQDLMVQICWPIHPNRGIHLLLNVVHSLKYKRSSFQMIVSSFYETDWSL